MSDYHIIALVLLAMFCRDIAYGLGKSVVTTWSARRFERECVKALNLKPERIIFDPKIK
jgi:hypothetical protein